MSSRRVVIDRLEIRLKGVTSRSARAAVGDLGRELLAELRSDHGTAGVPHRGVDRIDAGTAQVTTAATPSELRRTIAGRVAASIDGASHAY
jgi:hypothetical protein